MRRPNGPERPLAIGGCLADDPLSVPVEGYCSVPKKRVARQDGRLSTTLRHLGLERQCLSCRPAPSPSSSPTWRVDAAAQAAPRAVRRGARRARMAPARGLRGERWAGDRHPGRLVLRRLPPRPRRGRRGGWSTRARRPPVAGGGRRPRADGDSHWRAARRRGGYVGLGVHRAARISSAGHGGQVLLSNATRELSRTTYRPTFASVIWASTGSRTSTARNASSSSTSRASRASFRRSRPSSASPPRRPSPVARVSSPKPRKRSLARGFAAGAPWYYSSVLLVAAAALAAVLLAGGPRGRTRFAGSTRTRSASSTPATTRSPRRSRWTPRRDRWRYDRMRSGSPTPTPTPFRGSTSRRTPCGTRSGWAAARPPSRSRPMPCGRRTASTAPSPHRPEDERGGSENRRSATGRPPLPPARAQIWVANAIDARSRRSSPRRAPWSRIGVGGGANAVAVGFGAVWVANGTSASVSRVDPRANAVVQEVNVGNGPTALAAGFGSVWVANRADGTVSRIDPRATWSPRRSPSARARGRSRSAPTPSGSPTRLARETGEDRSPPQRGRAEARHGEPAGGGRGRRRHGLRGRPRDREGARGGTLRVQAGVVDSIDPSHRLRTLLVVDPQPHQRRTDGIQAVGGTTGSQLVPNLAAALPTVTDGGRTYTFRLRRGIRYSTGAPVRTADFRRAIERSLTAGEESSGPPLPGRDRRGRPLHRQLQPLQSLTWHRHERGSRHDHLPPHRARPRPAVQADAAVRAPGARRRAAERRKARALDRALHDRRELEARGRLERNPKFRPWSSAARPDGIPDTIVWRLDDTPESQVAAVERGEADVAFDAVPASRFERIATRFASRLHSNPAHAAYFVFLNTRVPPFDDVRVRRALNYALDRNAVVQAYGGPEQAQLTCQVLPPNLPGTGRTAPTRRTQPPEAPGRRRTSTRAKRLIDASGTRGMTVSLWGSKAFPRRRGTAGVVSLLRGLGYRVRLRSIDGANEYYFKTSDTRNRVQAGANGWFIDYQSAFGFITVLSCGSFVPRSGEGPTSTWPGSATAGSSGTSRGR